MRRVPCLLIALLALVAPVSAGTPDDPEITDPSGDAPMPATTNPGAQDAIDLVAVWLEPGNGTLTVNWQVVALAVPEESDRFEYGIDFVVGGEEFHAQAWRQNSDSVQGAALWVSDAWDLCAHTDRSLADEAVELLIEGAVVSVVLPQACLGEPANVTDIKAYAAHYAMGPDNLSLTDPTQDETDRGRDLVVEDPEEPVEDSMEEPVDDAGPDEPTEKKTPGPGPLWLVPALLFAWLRRRGLER